MDEIEALEALWCLMILGSLLLVSLMLFSVSKQKEKEKKFIENHRKIQPGMSKAQVLGILGNQYTQSYLKNNIEKLEWRYRLPGYTGRIAKGAYMHTSALTRRISVKFKDNRVIEVNSLNMD